MRDDDRFRDLVRRAAPLTYATRCQLVADEVRRQYAAPNPLAARAWLDEQVVTLAAVPGTMVGRLLEQAALAANDGKAPAALRAWAFDRIDPGDGKGWGAGADSPAMWALLMAPVPANEEELAWLAQITHVGLPGLRTLVGDSARPC